MENPTKQTYDGFLYYYDKFNKLFFDNTLPPCLITYQRGKAFMAYYCYERFEKNGNHTDEIAINPQAFIGKSKTEVLQTLLHEMTHMKQYHFGKPSRGGYHNKEWAGIMKSVGLQPVGVGKDNLGKETGQRVSDEIIPGGLLDNFIKTDTFDFEMWVDSMPVEIDDNDNKKGPKELMLDKLNENPITQIEVEPVEYLEKQKGYLENYFNSVKDEAEDLAKEQGYKIKYSCKCGINIWAKASIKMICLECNGVFLYSL